MPIAIKDRDRGLSRERLRDLLEYDPASGAFTWLTSRGRSPAGAMQRQSSFMASSQG